MAVSGDNDPEKTRPIARPSKPESSFQDNPQDVLDELLRGATVEESGEESGTASGIEKIPDVLQGQDDLDEILKLAALPEQASPSASRMGESEEDEEAKKALEDLLSTEVKKAPEDVNASLASISQEIADVPSEPVMAQSKDTAEPAIQEEPQKPSLSSLAMPGMEEKRRNASAVEKKADAEAIFTASSLAMPKKSEVKAPSAPEPTPMSEPVPVVFPPPRAEAMQAEVEAMPGDVEWEEEEEGSGLGRFFIWVSILLFLATLVNLVMILKGRFG